MGVKDIQNKMAVKEGQVLTFTAAGAQSIGAIDTQGFERGLMFALDVTSVSIALATDKLTSSSTVATAEIADTSGLVVGQTVVIAGATQTEYNGTYTITTIPTATTFTYTFAGSATTPATTTTTITVAFTPGEALASAVAAGSYSITDSADNSTFAAVAADSYLPTRKQTANALIDVGQDSGDSDYWQQTFGVFGNKRHVKATLTLTAIASDATIVVNITPILEAELTPFEDWDSTVTGDSEG